MGNNLSLSEQDLDQLSQNTKCKFFASPHPSRVCPQQMLI
jgi:hypothetical protein